MTPRRPPRPALNAPIAELADMLEPDAPAEDFAFADTVIAPDDLIPPPSGRARNQPSHQASAPNELWAMTRHGVAEAREELMELWVSTEDLVGTASARGALGRLRFFGRRLVALWSFWHWDRTDLVRAAMIGIAVFLAAATFGASTLASDDASSSTSEDLRSARTPDPRLPPPATAQPVRVASARGR